MINYLKEEKEKSCDWLYFTLYLHLKVFYVRGVLGNKCAGHYNLKTVHFRETLASDNFLACSSAIRVFFLQRSIYHRTAGASFYVMMVGVTP
jgi:hypothetical protein